MCSSFFLSLMAKILFIAPKKNDKPLDIGGVIMPLAFPCFLVPITWLHANGRQVMGTPKKKGRAEGTTLLQHENLP